MEGTIPEFPSGEFFLFLLLFLLFFSGDVQVAIFEGHFKILFGKAWGGKLDFVMIIGFLYVKGRFHGFPVPKWIVQKTLVPKAIAKKIVQIEQILGGRISKRPSSKFN